MKSLKRWVHSVPLLVAVNCVFSAVPVGAQSQQAVFSGGSTKSTVTQPATSGLRSRDSSWHRQQPNVVKVAYPSDNQIPPSPVVFASSEQPLLVPEDDDSRGAGPASAVASDENKAVPQQTSQRIALSDPDAATLRAQDQSSGLFQTILSVGSSLLIVVGLFLGVAWCYRRTLNSSLTAVLPKHVVRILGRTPLAARQQLVLVRFGSKLVLVSLVQGEARTISEITDPLEVDRLAGLCESQQSGSISESFRSVLSQGTAT